LCVSQQGEFKNTIKHFLVVVFGKVHIKNFWPKKIDKFEFSGLILENTFMVFLGSSCRETDKNAIKKNRWEKTTGKKFFFLKFEKNLKKGR
jgi:hypothetical protein